MFIYSLKESNNYEEWSIFKNWYLWINEKFTYILLKYLNESLSLKIYFSFLIDCSWIGWTFKTFFCFESSYILNKTCLKELEISSIISSTFIIWNNCFQIINIFLASQFDHMNLLIIVKLRFVLIFLWSSVKVSACI